MCYGVCPSGLTEPQRRKRIDCFIVFAAVLEESTAFFVPREERKAGSGRKTGILIDGHKAVKQERAGKNALLRDRRSRAQGAGKRRGKSKRSKMKKRIGGKEFEGTVRICAKGYGFITPDPGSGITGELYVAKRDTRGALSGDRVKAVLLPDEKYGAHRGGAKRKDGREKEGGSAAVLSVCARAPHVYAGTVYTRPGSPGLFVRPDALRCEGEICLTGDLTGLSPGDILTFDLVCMPETVRTGETVSYGIAVPLQTVGKQGDIGADIGAIAAVHGLPASFPEDVMEESRACSGRISGEELAEELARGRRDLRTLRIVTIDSAETKDVDDGVSLQINEKGNYVLGVHIADVTHYVKEGSRLDQEARSRGTSVYLADRVIPMLPRALSNGICSLQTGENRFALSVMMEIDRDGTVLSDEIFESLICVEYKITYEQLYRLLENGAEGDLAPYAKYREDLERMRELAALLGDVRARAGSVDFCFPETHVTLDEKGRPTEISEYRLTYANNIIEEFMLLCNRTVAETFCRRGVPFLYRVHEAPAPERTEELSRAVQNLGFHLCRNRDGAVEPQDYRQLMKEAEGHPFEAVISLLALRSMKKAAYSRENKGHFGLAFSDYTHFTSPIRRYPDLFIHRVIKLVLTGTLEKEQEQRLFAEAEMLADSCSAAERNAEEAERESIDLKVTEYMSRFLGERFTGIVSSVTSFGFFVRLENSAEGLVRYESFEEDYYDFDPDRLIAASRFTGKKIRIGDRFPVIVAACDPVMRRIEFVPAEAGGQKRPGGKGKAARGRGKAGPGRGRTKNGAHASRRGSHAPQRHGKSPSGRKPAAKG